MDPPIFLAGGSRVARLAIFRWPGPRPVAFGRRDAPGIDRTWDMLKAPPPMEDARVVVNFAGVTPRSGAPPSGNSDLALAGLEAARIWGARHFFVMSSSAVYGDTGPETAPETRAPSPVNAYGVAKAAMETAVLDASRRPGGPGITILRLANVAGAGQPFDAARGAGRSTVSLHRFADGRGPSRSYIGPATLARCLSRLCALAARGNAMPAILNLAAPAPTAMSDILEGLGTPFIWADAPRDAIQHVHLDTQLLAQLCPGLAADGGAARTLISEARTPPDGTET